MDIKKMFFIMSVVVLFSVPGQANPNLLAKSQNFERYMKQEIDMYTQNIAELKKDSRKLSLWKIGSKTVIIAGGVVLLFYGAGPTVSAAADMAHLAGGLSAIFGIGFPFVGRSYLIENTESIYEIHTHKFNKIPEILGFKDTSLQFAKNSYYQLSPEERAHYVQQLVQTIHVLPVLYKEAVFQLSLEVNKNIEYSDPNKKSAFERSIALYGDQKRFVNEVIKGLEMRKQVAQRTVDLNQVAREELEMIQRIEASK